MFRVIAALIAGFLSLSEARAQVVGLGRIGAQDSIHFIQDVTLKGPQNEALFLGYATRTKMFLAGVYIVDEGYVLGIKDRSSSFYPIPKGAELDRFQQAGLLPNPLPPYRLSVSDYLLGYSLWGILFIAIAWGAGGPLMRRRKSAPVASSQRPSGDPS
jgi:hypothetical protein